MTIRFLLAIGIGPAQDFIASARRSRDLWFSSWLLSEVSKAAARSIDSRNGKLIFPFPLNPATDLQAESGFSVVNKLVAEIETDDIKTFCDGSGNNDGIYGAMLGRLRALRDDAFKQMKGIKDKVWDKNGNEKDAVHKAIAEKQIDDLIEFYWAALPLDDLNNYVEVRKQLENLLAARKATRNFRAVEWGDYVPKSSLDGLRESVIDEAVFRPLDDRTLTPKQKAKVEKDLRLKYGVRGKERLCGVGLLKRHGRWRKNTEDTDSFFSTSHVAALPLLNRLKDKTAVKNYLDELTKLLVIGDDKEIKRYLGHVPKNATRRPHPYFCNDDGSLLYDGHLIFKERLHEFFPDEDDRTAAEKALDKFFVEAFGKQQTPIPYYAIIHADGDRMGATIDEEGKKGVERHRKFSQQLSEFAATVKHIVEVDHDGSCVYAGGDDVLAFVPLHTALQCARALAEAFRGAMQADEFQDAKGNRPSLSVGMAVGHHLNPLQDTLNLARQAERIAKNEVTGKNALAVTISKRSGTDRTVKGSWGSGAPGGALDRRLIYFVFLHLKDELPDGAAYELQKLSLTLKPPTDGEEQAKEALLEAQRAEAKRILKRKQPRHSKEKALADEVYERLHDLIETQKLPIGELAEEIIVARLFADAMEQSGEKADEYAVKNGIKLKGVAEGGSATMKTAKTEDSDDDGEASGQEGASGASGTATSDEEEQHL